MIERFLLPYRAAAVCVFIDGVSRGSLYALCDSLQTDNVGFQRINERPEDQMYVVWHHDRRAEVVSGIVIVKTTPKHDVSCPARENTPIMSREGQEVKTIVRLDVGKVAFVVTHMAAAELRSA